MSILNKVILTFLLISILLSQSISVGIVFAQTQTQSLFGVPSPEIIINKTEFLPGEKIEIIIQKMPQIPPNTDPRLELYLYLPFLQKIGENVPLNCLGENCIVVYSFDEIRKGETNPKIISFVLFSEKNPKPVVESGWMNSVCDLKFDGKTIERYGSTCNSLDLPPDIYDIKFGWGIEISDKFEIIKTIPITIKEYSDNLESKTQTSEKFAEDMLDQEIETKELIDIGSEIEKIDDDTEIGNVAEKESESVHEIDEIAPKEGGGCLIATATFGSELAPQVQQLREIRDNTILSTTSGSVFMSGFNQLYYSFSPTIADLERENPMFQQAVRAFITPMISTLSIMTLAEGGNDAEIFGLGISVIVLNLGMYVGIPAAMIVGIRRKS